jgi:hypothetical protein
VAIHYTKYQLKNDLDCVLSLCAAENSRREIRKLARAKLTGKPYEIPAIGIAMTGAECASCGKSFYPRRSDARFCSARCRQRDRRRNTSGMSQISR